MPSFLFSAFAVAGAIAATGPLVIHLLNRRRFRVVRWAAMDFLREAMQRNRKILQLRDIILLVLRTAVVLLLGLALARPFFSQHSGTAAINEPLHAVLVVDNSLSMSYRQAGKTLLSEAKVRLTELIDALPEGSRISLLPLCGSANHISDDPYVTKEDALAALDKIEIVDRSGTVAEAISKATRACQQVPDMPAKRVILVGDQQRSNWRGITADSFRDLTDVQIVDVSAPKVENTWISDFRLRDGVADPETEASFVATIRHEGAEPRADVQLTLNVDGVDVRTYTVREIAPGQSAEIELKHRIEAPTEPGKTNFVPAKVSLQADRLEGDDARYLVAPVVSGVPVVFIDQYGDQENVKQNKYGETYFLRKLLDPVIGHAGAGHKLLPIHHVRIDQVDRDLLKDARLVVIAGVARPDPAVPLLREYVEQGGQLLIAAGADFDPSAWNDTAWLGGEGILPAKLKTPVVGHTPEESTQDLRLFDLDLSAPERRTHRYFQFPATPPDELADLFKEPIFFKAVDTQLDDEQQAALQAAELKRIEERQNVLTQLDQRAKLRKAAEAKGPLDDAQRREQAADDQQRAQLEPHWLQWTVSEPPVNASLSAADLAKQSLPHVLASFSNGVPFLVERNIGHGRVLLVSSGVASSWNNMPKLKAFPAIFDGILRSMIEPSIPQRNLPTGAEKTIPIDAADHLDSFTLTRPGGTTDSFDRPDSLGPDTYGLTIKDTLQRGIYTVTAHRAESASNQDAKRDDIHWQQPFAFNGDPEESVLTSVTAADVDDLLKTADGKPSGVSWVPVGQKISLEGTQVSGQNLWRWLIQLVLICLLVEMIILAWPLSLLRLAGLVALGMAILYITTGNAVGTYEVVTQYLVLGLGLAALVGLLVLHFVAPKKLETA